MKQLKLLTLILALSVFSTISAQKKGDVNVDGKVDISDIVAVINIIAFGGDEYNPEIPDEAVVLGFCPDSGHPHAIDLGEAGKWSCCNVGAAAPWEYGGYYAWGEIEEKEKYTVETYLYSSLEFGDHGNWIWTNIGLDIAGSDFDVAHVKWGNNWIMPNVEQWLLLLDNCSVARAKIKGVDGTKFTGSNGNSIFIPHAGYPTDNGETKGVGSWSSFWTSTLVPPERNQNIPSNAFCLSVRPTDIRRPDQSSGIGFPRSAGFSVRPISQ